MTSEVLTTMAAVARPVPARPDGVKPTIVHCRRDGTEAINEKELATLDGDQHVYHAKDVGIDSFLNHCIVPREMTLKVGYDARARRHQPKRSSCIDCCFCW
jgi:hypothetical protein